MEQQLTVIGSNDIKSGGEHKGFEVVCSVTTPKGVEMGRLLDWNDALKFEAGQTYVPEFIPSADKNKRLRARVSSLHPLGTKVPEFCNVVFTVGGLADDKNFRGEKIRVVHLSWMNERLNFARAVLGEGLKAPELGKQILVSFRLDLAFDGDLDPVMAGFKLYEAPKSPEVKKAA